MSASSSAISTRREAWVSTWVMTTLCRDLPRSSTGGLCRSPRDGHPLWWEAVADRPSYPNWQRKRIQNPSSVSSNLTEGTEEDGGTVEIPTHPLGCQTVSASVHVLGQGTPDRASARCGLDGPHQFGDVGDAD